MGHATINADLGFHPVNVTMEIIRSDLTPSPRTPCPLQQHPRYGQVLRAMGAKVETLSVVLAGRVLGHAQIVTRKLGPAHLRWLPRGPVWTGDIPFDDRIRATRAVLDCQNRQTFRIATPETPEEARHLGGRAAFTAQYVAEIDLTAGIDTRLAAQHGKWRNRLRHGEKSGLRTTHRQLILPRDDALLRQELSQRRQRRYAALPYRFVQQWAQMHPGSTQLFKAKCAGHTVAFILVLLHTPCASYHIGWTSPLGRRLSAHNLLMWRASNWLAAKGYRRFDLGSVDTRHSPGLARFKIGSGAHIRALGPTLIYLPKLRFARLFSHRAA